MMPKSYTLKTTNGMSSLMQDFSQPVISATVIQHSVSDPVPQKDFAGMGKTELKLTVRDAAGVVKGIFRLASSVRGDVVDADRDAMLADVLALAGTQEFALGVKRGKVATAITIA